MGYSLWGLKESDTTEWLSMNINSLTRDWIQTPGNESMVS